MKRKPCEIAISVGAPLTLAIVEVFHPHPHDLFHLDLQRWMVVHYLQIPLFPLSAYAMVLLLRGLNGFGASLARAAMFIFAVSFVAFDTAAGVVTGVLLKAAQASSPSQWQAPVMAVWTHPIVGGAPGTVPVLAIVGTLAWLIGSASAAWLVWRLKRSSLAAIFLLISGLGLFVFRTHAWPGGPITFGALAIAAMIIQLRANANEPAETR